MPQVGSEVSRRARGLGLTVVAYDPYASSEKAGALGVALVSFEQALSVGDFFSLHTPLTPTTKKLFNGGGGACVQRVGRRGLGAR